VGCLDTLLLLLDNLNALCDMLVFTLREAFEDFFSQPCLSVLLLLRGSNPNTKATCKLGSSETSKKQVIELDY
jgi:hypothetical protein